MPKFSLEDRYKSFPALVRAIKAHRNARLACNADRNYTTLYWLNRARLEEQRIRRQLAPALKLHNETLRHDRDHARRYHYQIVTHKSRTLDPAAQLHQARTLARAAAALHASNKRANNRAANQNKVGKPIDNIRA